MFLKYNDHKIYIQFILNVETKPIYLILNSTETILVSLTKVLIFIPRKHPEDL